MRQYLTQKKEEINQGLKPRNLEFLIMLFTIVFTMAACVRSAIPMVDVTGGTFDISIIGKVNLDTVHSVILNSFSISKYEITQELWESVTGNNPSQFKGRKNPVEKVSWYDCIRFCNALSCKEGLEECYNIRNDSVYFLSGRSGYRLPTEAEWEFASRGGLKSKGYEYSGSDSIDVVAWYVDNSDNQPKPVGKKKRNELGLYDMSGNVWEWCWDWYDVYTKESQDNPLGPPLGSDKVNRGGSYYSVKTSCRSFNRNCTNPSLRYEYIGVRLVRTIVSK